MRKALQKISAALMVPVVILPIGALFLAIGTQLNFAPLMASGRAILLEYLPLLFAVGVSIGFTGYDGMAGFAGVVGYLVLTGALRSINSELDMGVLGGITAGIVAATLYARYHTVRLPEYLGLFSGKRFVPVITAAATLVLGTVLGYAWLPVQTAIFDFGGWIMGSGAIGLFFYGFTNRLLIPTGLHHIINNLILYTFGTYSDPASGALYQGEVQRFFAGDPTAGTFSAGFYLIMLFAIPAACLAMVREARPEQRKRTAGILITAALTSIITGITEPAEFTFMFAAPVLFALHSLLTGVATLLAHIFNIRHYGYALPMYFINWGFSENAILVLPLGLLYGFLYYYGFRYLIRRFNLPTLGRTNDAVTTESSSPANASVSRLLEAIGGRSNLVAVDSCMSRLRLTLVDNTRVDESQLKSMNALGIKRIGSDCLQIVMGSQSQELADDLRKLTQGLPNALYTPVSGTIVPLAEIDDDVFSGGLLGAGVGIKPSEYDNLVLAPISGIVERVFPGGHAIVVKTLHGDSILIHVGINTVELKGLGFEVLVKQGAFVNAGEPLLSVMWPILHEHNKDTVAILVAMDSESSNWDIASKGIVSAGKDIVAKRR